MSKTLLDKWTFVNRVNADTELPQPAAKVVMTLVWYMNCKHETCFPSQMSLIAATGLSERSIRQCLVALRERGWLEWEPRMQNGRKVGHLYRMHWDARPEILAPDQAVPQQPPQPAPDAGPVPEQTGTTCRRQPAPDAGPYEHGKGTREDIPSSSRTASEEAKSVKPLASAETKPPLQEGSPEWWKNRVWNETGPRFKARFFPTISKAAFGKRLGSIIRQQQHDLRTVDRVLASALEAEPGGDAWEYVAGVLRRQRQEATTKAIDYSTPLKTRGVM